MNKDTNSIVLSRNKKKKITDDLKAIPVKQLFLGEYLNIHTFQKHIITESFILEEAKRLRDWAMLDDSLLLQDFSDDRGYRRILFYEWVKKYPVMKAAHEFALSKLGSRREKGAMLRKFEASTTQRTLGHYQDIWKAETRELAKMKEDLAQHNEQRVIVIERFPEVVSSGRTPEQVAGEIHQSTRESRKVGSNEYALRKLTPEE